jgi:glycosyltransferase involved in cell wall biosynthesis
MASQLSSRTSPSLLAADLQRLNRHYHGPYALTGALSGSSLIIGGRSGLFALVLAVTNPHQAVFVIERDSGLREAIRESARHLGAGNLRLHAAWDECLATLEMADPDLGLVWIDQSCFSMRLLAELTRSFRIEHLTGEFAEAQANPLWVHRLSREMARAFHWQNLTTGFPMPGSGLKGPDVSVIVPAHGIEQYLDHCMESLLNQTLNTLEIIVVDDGARDRSGEIADEWAQRDPRVRVIHQPNAGCAAARSNGLKAARGMFVGLVDGDDWVDPPMFQALAESAVRLNSDIAQCGYRHCYDSDNTRSDVREYFSLAKKTGEGNGLVANPKDLIPWRPTIWRRLYRRDFLVGNAINFPRAIRRFDDLPFHFMTLALAERLSVVNACYYNYRQQRSGQDIGVDDERLYVHFPIFRILKDFVRQHHSRELEEKLFMTQLASHEWASRVIQPHLLASYQAAAKYELFEDPIFLTPAELLRMSRRYDRRKSRWAWRLKRKRGSGKEAWLALKDYAR